MLVKLQSAVSLITCGCLVSLAASPSSIGFVVTNGQAFVDGALVQRNATLFQGSLVRADEVNSDLVLPGGSNLLLEPGSSANVYKDYAALRQGTVTERGGRYTLLVNGLRVSSLATDGAVAVGFKDGSHLQVNALTGPAEVRNPAGVLIAHLEQGRALNFVLQATTQAPADTTPRQGVSTPPADAPQTSTAASATPGLPEPGQQLTLHGIMRKDHAGSYGHYLLTDVASKVTYQLQGSGLDDLVGGSVEVIGTVLGTAPAEGSSRVLSVFDIHQMTMGEITGTPEPAEPAAEAPATPPVTTAEAAPPAPGPGTKTTPPAESAPAESAPDLSAPPPLPVQHSTAKVLVIVALAAGGAVGVALGLAGGKNSTVSPE